MCMRTRARAHKHVSLKRVIVFRVIMISPLALCLALSHSLITVNVYHRPVRVHQECVCVCVCVCGERECVGRKERKWEAIERTISTCEKKEKKRHFFPLSRGMQKQRR